MRSAMIRCDFKRMRDIVITNTQNNKNKTENSVENSNFLFEEYKTIREEITATKSRLFLTTSIGIVAIPLLLNWAKDNIGVNSFYLLSIECAIPLLCIASVLIFLSENKNLMRCGRYIRKCIEPSLIDNDKYPNHKGWEKWLESDDIPNKKDSMVEEKLKKILNNLPSFIVGRNYLLDKKNFDNRAVDRLVVASFMLIFYTYYVLSSSIAVVSIFSFKHNHLYFKQDHSTFLILFGLIAIFLYFYLGLFFGSYLFLHYKDLISTEDLDEKKIFSFDIGGTNGRSAVFNFKSNKIIYDNEVNRKSGDFETFFDFFSEIKRDHNINNILNDVYQLVVAVPGAVTQDGLIHLPYVRWKTIDQVEFKKQYPHAVFINDFVAQAYGCLTEAAENSITLLVGNDQRQGDIAIVGAGTGTGHGTLKKTRKKFYECVSSEAGHIPFPFLYEDKTEMDFRKFLIKEKGIAIPVCNDVVSGPGLSRLHHFFTGKELQASEVVKEISIDLDTTKYFARFYGRACRNYVVSTLAVGGTLYISGGVAIKNPFLINNKYFTEEFLKSSTTTKELLAQISVKLIQDERIGLFGAAYYGVHVASLQ